VLTFADPEIIQMASEKFVPVTGDDWYERRREDDEGEFFRAIAKAAGKDGGGQPSGGSTRQGIYCLTADGTFLAYRNAGNAPDVMRQVLKQALAKWEKLPEEKRKPGAVTVPELTKVDARYHRAPPKGGLIVNAFTRVLEKDENGKWTKGVSKFKGGDMAARDHLWLTEAEWKGLVPAEPKVGDKSPLSPAVAERIARFHLIDNTRGEPPLWGRDDVRAKEMSLTVQEANESTILLRLDGQALLSSRADLEKSERGYDARLFGWIGYDRKKQTITRFDVVALGEHWGHGTYTPNARPGRAPLGVAFELATGKSAADLVPPQGSRELNVYFGK